MAWSWLTTLFDKMQAAATPPTAAPPLPPVPPSPKPTAAQPITTDVLDMLEAMEGFRSAPYLDSAGVTTIGIGTTRYPDGTSVKHNDSPISRETAKTYAANDLGTVLSKVVALAVVPLTPGQAVALALFAYNLGLGALGGSTLLKLLKQGQVNAAAAQFMAWNKAHDGPGGPLIELKGLTRRRRAEQLIFQGSGAMAAWRQAQREIP